ncbi:MAG: 50S ribosomal protein L25 [Bacteroidota bacterium]
MKTTDLKATKREDQSKAFTRQLRREGKVPGVLYKKGEAESLYTDYKELGKSIYTPETYIVNLDLDGGSQSTILREVQFHPVTEKILHVEFLAIDDKTPVTIQLPVFLTGKAEGVSKGGKLRTSLRKVTVKGIPSELPEKVEVNVSGLDLGQTIKVSEVDFGDLNVVTSPSTAIASVEIPRALRSAAAGKEGVEGDAAAEAAEE